MPEYLTTRADGVLEFRFNRPESRNSLTFEMYGALEEACNGADPADTSALVLTAEGDKAFAAGTDISKFRDFKSPDDAIKYESMILRVVEAVAGCRVPVIASLHGVVAGGGAALAAASDIRIATPDTRLGIPVAKTLGNCLSVANLSSLCRLLGESRVRYFLLTAEFLEIDSLRASGMVSEVLPDAAACDGRARDIARKMGDLAPLTLKATREGLRRIHESELPDDRDLIEMCYLSGDFKEGIEAFFEKRGAKWSGK